MSKTYSFYMNHSEEVAFCSKYKCTTEELGRVLKAIATNATASPYFRELDGVYDVHRLIQLVKHSEDYETSSETKELIKGIMREYILTMKELINESPNIKNIVLS